MNRIKSGFKKYRIWLVLSLALILIFRVWTMSGFNSTYIDTDIGRDLKEISNIQAHRIVWLGPRLAPGLQASSIYYYLFYPAVALAGGKIDGLIAFNVAIGLLAIGLFGFFATKKYGYKGIISTLLLGFLPLVTSNILHPGNGYTYLFLVLLCLTALWFKLPLLIASLAGGFAFALHPAAGFLPFFLLYEWWQRGRKWMLAILNLGAFLIPLAPLIAYEAITKGYITRSFLANPQTNGISIGFSWMNLATVSNLLGLSFLAVILLMGISGWVSVKTKSPRLKTWWLITLVLVVLTLFFHNLVDRYLFGIAVMVIFTIVISFMQSWKTTLLLLILVVVLGIRSPLFHPLPIAVRNADKVEATADFVANHNLVDKSKKIAVVSVLSAKAEVPQADDYRFLLRNRGYNVVEITDNNVADELVLFVEVPDFKWQTWSSWETDSFGPKKVEKVEVYQGTTVVVFTKD